MTKAADLFGLPFFNAVYYISKENLCQHRIYLQKKATLPVRS